MDVRLKWQKILKDGEKFAKNELGMNIDIPIELNGRIKALGNFTGQQAFGRRLAIKINISKNHFIFDDYDMVLDTLKHELCHYYLFKKGSQGWRDGDKEFEKLLKKHNILSSGKTKNTFGNKAVAYSNRPVIYYIDKMGNTIKRNRRLNRGSYFTGKNGRYYEVGKYTPEQFEKIKIKILENIQAI